MADWMDSISRGFRSGNEIGENLAARGLRKRTADAERQLLEDKLTPEQYEQAIRDAQGRGFARFRDTDALAEDLRARPLDVLNRRDRRSSAERAIEGDFGGVADYTGREAARMGNLSSAIASRDLTEAVRRGGMVNRLPTGELDYRAATRQGEDDQLKRGNLSGAQAATTQGQTVMTQMTAKMTNDALNARDAGDMEGFIGRLNSVAELRGLPMQFQTDASGGVFTTDGTGAVKKIDDTTLNNLLYQMGEGNDTQLNRTLQLEAQNVADERAFESEVTMLATKNAFDIVRELDLPDAVIPQIQALSTAQTRMAASGAKDIATMPNGDVLMQIGDMRIEARAAPEPTGDDPDALTDNKTQYFLAGTNTRVDLNDIPDAVERSTDEFRLAAQAVAAQGDFDRVVEMLNMKLATNDAIMQGALGRTGPGPVLSALMRTNRRISDEKLAPALDAFMGVVDQLEGRGPNGASSATGPGQFVDRTFVDLANKSFPDSPVTAQIQEAAKLTGAERKAALAAIKSDPANEAFMLDMTRELAAQNAPQLASARVEVNPLSLYVMHHFNPQTGVDFMRKLAQNPNTPVGEVLSKGELDANPKYRELGTLGAVVGFWANRVPDLLTGLPEDTAAALTGGAGPAVAQQGGGAQTAGEPVAQNDTAAPAAGAAPAPAPAGPVDPLSRVAEINAAAQRGEEATAAVRVFDQQIAALRAKQTERDTRAIQRAVPVSGGYMYSTPAQSMDPEDAKLLNELVQRREQYVELARREQSAGRLAADQQRAQGLRTDARSTLDRYPTPGLPRQTGAQ